VSVLCGCLYTIYNSYANSLVIRFFGATFIGKALIKVNLQAMAMIVIFSSAFTARLAAFLDAAQAALPAALWTWGDKQIKLSAIVNDAVAAAKTKMHDKADANANANNNDGAGGSDDTPLFQQLWAYFMILFIGMFAKSSE
jgi:hypothetical protein